MCRVPWPRRGCETPGKVSFELQLEEQTEGSRTVQAKARGREWRSSSVADIGRPREQEGSLACQV